MRARVLCAVRDWHTPSLHAKSYRQAWCARGCGVQDESWICMLEATCRRISDWARNALGQNLLQDGECRPARSLADAARGGLSCLDHGAFSG